MAPPTDDPGAAPDRDERRAFWRAAVIMSTAIVALIVLFVVFSPSPGKGLTKQQEINKLMTHPPQIIPSPADRQAASQPGDPGGWEQVTLLGVMVAGMLTVGGLAWRSSRRAKRRRAGAGAGAAPPPGATGSAHDVEATNAATTAASSRPRSS